MDVLADVLHAMRSGLPRAARTDVRAPWGLRFPEINGASFHIVVRGSCWLLPIGHQPEPRQLFPGDLVLVRNGSVHALADDPASRLTDFEPLLDNPRSPIARVILDGPGAESLLLCGGYEFGRGRPHPLLTELPEVLCLPERSGKHHGLKATIELLGAELEDPRPGGGGIVPALVDALLLYILRAWLDDQPTETHSWANAFRDPAVSAALASMHADPGRRWTLQDLSATANLGRSAFAQRFASLVGVPPLTYLTWWRMTLAERRLRDSNVPLSIIGRELGYTSEFAFAKAFKRDFTLPPGRYRQTLTGTGRD
ncbi:AraC family transcriptional regulator [Kribbella sp. NPDC003505]|uniref:AraC family transcriptional regulator n=1 Tax=Kribbella sp. NPDC003505 TaxID=3154448 RepID=UPI0033AF7C80